MGITLNKTKCTSCVCVVADVGGEAGSTGGHAAVQRGRGGDGGLWRSLQPRPLLPIPHTQLP